jgi:hypothetical protein
MVVDNQIKKRTIQQLGIVRQIFQQASCLQAEGSEHGYAVEQDTLVPVLHRPEIRRKLLLLNIEYDDPSQLFRIVDSDGNGAVPCGEFTKNFMRMRGTAKAKDLLAIRAQVYRVERHLSQIFDHMAEVRAILEKQQTVRSLDNGSMKGVSSLLEAPDVGKLGSSTSEFVQGELRSQMNQMSKELQQQIAGLKDHMSRIVDERIGFFENHFRRLSGAEPLSGVAATLYEDPSTIATVCTGAKIPSEQSLPSMPVQACCSFAIGGSDRAIVAPMSPIAVTPIAAQSVLPVKNAFRTDYSSMRLASVLQSEHKDLMLHMEEKHNALISKLNTGLPGAGQSEPKAQQILGIPSVSLQSVAVQTSDVVADLPVLPIFDVALPGGEQGEPMTQAGRSNGTGAAPNGVTMVMGQAVEDDAAQEVHPYSEDETTKSSTKKLKASFTKELQARKGNDVHHLNQVERFVHGPWFESFFAGLITINAFVMAASTQYSGIDNGFKLNYKGSYQSASNAWPGARETFDVLEYIFGIIFVLELLIKILVFRISFLRSAWNILDTIIVGGWLVDTFMTVEAPINPMILRLFRLVKLLRVAKLFKSFQAFDSLSILIGSLRASGATLFWSLVVLFAAQLAVALFFCQLLESYMLDTGQDLQDRFEIYKYFGTFTRSFITTMQITIGNWAPIVILLREKVNEAWVAFVLVYVLFVSFAAIKVISAVFIVETQKVASTDEELLILQKERQITRLNRNFAGVFHEIDESGDGLINWDEFNQILRDHRVLTWLAALDLDIEQCEGMFQLLDGGDGRISFQEFVSGVQRLKGAAKSVDLVMLMSRQQEMAGQVSRLMRLMESYFKQSAVTPT